MDGQQFIAGIEGGATYSTLVLLNSAGKIITKIKGPGTNHFLLGIPECQKRIAEMVNQAKKEVRIPQEHPLAALGLSLSGCEHDDTNQEIINGLRRDYPSISKQYAIDSDTVGPVALTSNQGGITCISGTGSNTLLINSDNSRVQCGGWGNLLGDEGSGWYVAHRAIKICIDDQDGFSISPHSTEAVWELVKEHFNIEEKQGLLEYFYTNFDKALIASLCKKLSVLATKGDELSKSLFAEAGRDLAKFISVVVPKASEKLTKRAGGAHVVCVGSVWLSWELLKDGFVSYLRDHTDIKELTLVKSVATLAIGAAYMAADRLNVPLNRDYEHNYTVIYNYRKNA